MLEIPINKFLDASLMAIKCTKSGATVQELAGSRADRQIVFQLNTVDMTALLEYLDQTYSII